MLLTYFSTHCNMTSVPNIPFKQLLPRSKFKYKDYFQFYSSVIYQKPWSLITHTFLLKHSFILTSMASNVPDFPPLSLAILQLLNAFFLHTLNRLLHFVTGTVVEAGDKAEYKTVKHLYPHGVHCQVQEDDHNTNWLGVC